MKVRRLTAALMAGALAAGAVGCGGSAGTEGGKRRFLRQYSDNLGDRF